MDLLRRYGEFSEVEGNLASLDALLTRLAAHWGMTRSRLRVLDILAWSVIHYGKSPFHTH
jgi:hypothetical protein